jgi:ApeA N-terminal domain 1
MMKEFKVSGLWRFPGKRRKKWAGTLSYHPQHGASLELVGRAKEIYNLSQSIRKSNAAGYQEIILGSSPAGKADEFLITLYGCYVQNPVFRPLYEGSLRLYFYVKTVILGKHFSKSHGLKFKKLMVDFTYLFEWLNISGITSGIDLEIEKPDFLKKLDLDYLITYKRPAPIKVPIRNYTISLYFEKEQRPESTGIAKKESCVKQRVYAMIEFPKKQALGTFEDVCYHFRNFLSLGVAHPVYPQEIKARLDGEYGSEDIEVFILRPHYSITDIRLSFIDMLFTYTDISASFERYLSNWMENSDRLKPVYDLYFGVIHNPSTYLIHTFLSRIQALETYHRRLASKYELTNDVRDALVQEVRNRTGNKYDIKKLNNRKDPPLLMMILELLKFYEDVLHPVIAYWQHVDFAEFVKDNRHYYTHYNPVKARNAPTQDELWKANERMKFLLQACLLFELGLSKAQIKDLFSRNGEFNTLMLSLSTLSQHVIHIPLNRL